MKIYVFQSSQQLSISMDEAWRFFSDARKLPDITPPWMNFQVMGSLSKDMYPGMIATYRLQPLLGIPISWVTEITHVKEHQFFVDEQRFGPYRFWHHEHHFKKTEAGVDMTDIVHYALPFSWLGRVVHKINVEKKLQDIFHFRREKLKEHFGTVPNHT